MADVDCSGFVTGTRTQVVAVLNTAQTEGSEEETKTDSNVYGSAETLGTFASQTGRFICNGGVVTAENQASYAYVKSAGEIKMVIQSGHTARYTAHSRNAPYPKELLAGDQLITMANTSTDREAALCVATNQGNYHVFSVTPTGAAANQLVSILTGNSIGQTLQNQTVTHAYLLTEASEEIISAAGCYILDGSGVPIGCIPATNPTQAVGAWYPVSIPISLNTTAVVRTDA